MKRLSIIMMCFATMALASCDLTRNTTSGNEAKTSGRNTANAILALYNSYRSNGTISMSNANDLTSTLVVATGYTNLRNNQGNADYRRAFAAGMVSAGTGLITSANVERVINTMNGLTGLNVNASNISNSVGTATAVIQLLQALNTTAN